METAPLTLAQTHARNAALETKRSNPVAASEEHDLAAAEFAAAAQSTNDSEALRILSLLEEHHKRLGHILKSRHTTNTAETSTATGGEQPGLNTSPPPVSDNERSRSPDIPSQPPRLVRPARPSARDLSSSIASNLASARGIPSNRQKRLTPISPLVTNQHADGQFAQDEDDKTTLPSRKVSQTQNTRGANTASNRPSWAPPSDVTEAAVSAGQTAKADPTASDAPFQQFYSTFESLFSKLSAPLAFAGLPLTSPTPQPEPSTSNASAKRESQESRKKPAAKPLDASIDYSQLISRAALRAVSRDDKSSPFNKAAESFYVVPPSGGTISYADIMARADREASHHRRNTSNLSTGTDDFVDAASTILPNPMPPPRQPSGRHGTIQQHKYNGKTMEELGLENEALKHLSDTLSKRLHVFEMSAQTSSAALAQSIRSLHLSPFTTPENSRGKSNTTTAFSPDSTQGISANPETTKLKSRVAELEEFLHKSDAKARKREEENAKLKDTLVKYRDKWDSLKAGAKARRERVAGEAAGGTSAKGKEKSREKDDGDGDMS